MDRPPDRHIGELRQRIISAEYRVDSQAIAEAIVRRRWKVAIAAKPATTSVVLSRGTDRVQALAA